MNFDIASELSGLYDLSRTVPTLTIFFIAASGIFLLCFGIGIVLMTKRHVGLRFFPVLYGTTAYLLFYLLLGGFVTSLLALAVPENAGALTLALVRLLMLLVTSALIVAGRFFAMWFIRKFYREYCDAYGVGVGFSLTEAVMTGITVFFNYCLCTTLNESGLTSLVNSYDTAEEAIRQLESVMIFYDNPSYAYLLSGGESIFFMIFSTMISVMFYAVYHGELKRPHILSIVGLQTLMYLPGSLYSSGILFNRVGCFLTEALIFAACTLLFLRIHNTYYRNIAAPVGKSGSRSGRQSSRNTKMPDFNKNINK